MSVETHALGAPRVAAKRGGDCRARDLDQARNVLGPHRFASTTHCRIGNGMVRATVGAAGVTPTLTIEAQTGLQGTGDVYTDVYTDVYPGTYTAKAWTAMGVLTLDSSLLTALLTGVRIVRINPEAITLRLVAPVIADVFVTLRRGETMLHIQHGSTRAPVTTNRRIRWTTAGNLLTLNQSSIETDTTGWVAVIGCTVSRSTSQAADGAAALAVTSTAAGDVYVSTTPATGGVPVVAGATYTALASYRAATTGRTVRTAINWWTSGGAFISSSLGASTSDTTGAFAASSVTAVAPIGAAYAAVVSVVSGTAIGETHYVDKVSLAAGSSIVWALPLVGSAGTGLVQESVPLTDGFARFVAGRATVTSNAGAFSVTAAGVSSAELVAGVSPVSAEWMTVADLRMQSGDTSRPLLVVS